MGDPSELKCIRWDTAEWVCAGCLGLDPKQDQAEAVWTPFHRGPLLPGWDLIASEVDRSSVHVGPPEAARMMDTMEVRLRYQRMSAPAEESRQDAEIPGHLGDGALCPLTTSDAPPAPAAGAGYCTACGGERGQHKRGCPL